MARPVLVKLGGSLITDKAHERTFRRPQARRLVSECAKAGVPLVLTHGAGSFGHPQALRMRGPPSAVRDAVSDTLAATAELQSALLRILHQAGLRPMAVSLAGVEKEGDDLVHFPHDEIARLVDEGHTPVLGGTLVRGDAGWTVLSADTLMAQVAAEVAPRLGVFATDVDGIILDGELQREVGPDVRLAPGKDASGGMARKLVEARRVAASCPTWIVNGSVRNRLLDALKGKPLGSRIQGAG